MGPFTPPVKILQVTNTLGIGGAENCIRQLVLHTDPKRFSQKVVCTQGGGPFEQELNQQGVTVRVLNRPRRSIILFPIFLWDVLMTVVDLYAFLKKERPVILQTHLPASAYFAVIAGKMAGIPNLVYTFHSSNLLPPRKGFSLRNLLRRKLTQVLCRQVNVIVAVSQAIENRLLELIPNQVSLIRIIPNGIDIQTYKEVPASGALKKTLGMAPQAPLITMVGSLSLVKNQTMFLKALVSLVKSYPEVRAVLVGDGPQKNHLLSLCQELGLSPFVHFLGLRRDIPDILSETDIFVCTSRWEGLPLAILEAMAAGRPIVATNVPGVQEVLDQESGILVALDKPETLVESLVRLIEDPSLRLDLGRKARERVTEWYSLGNTISSWENLYTELLNKKE